MKQQTLSASLRDRVDKNLRTEWRTRGIAQREMLSFALVKLLVLFSFAFDLDRDERLAISGGLLWLAYAFAGAVDRQLSQLRARKSPTIASKSSIAAVPRLGHLPIGKSDGLFHPPADRRVGFTSDPLGLFYNIHAGSALVPVAPPARDSVNATWGHLRSVGGALSCRHGECATARV